MNIYSHPAVHLHHETLKRQHLNIKISFYWKYCRIMFMVLGNALRFRKEVSHIMHNREFTSIQTLLM